MHRESGNNNNTREIRTPIIKWREILAPHDAYDLNKHLINKIKHPISGCANSGSSETT